MSEKNITSNGLSSHIPVIDISQNDTETMAHFIVKAVAESGFVFVKGQDLGFTSQILDNVFNLVRRFAVMKKFDI